MSVLFTKLVLALLLCSLCYWVCQWMLRSTHKESAKTTGSLDGFIMTPSRAVRYVAFGGTAFFAALGALGVYAMLPWPKAALALGACSYGVIFLIVAPALYSLRRRIYVSCEGLQSFSPWTGRKSATWNEVESVSYFKERGGTIRIHLRSGSIVGIPCMMNGFQQLEAAMREQLQPFVFEPAFEEYRTDRRLGRGQQ